MKIVPILTCFAILTSVGLAQDTNVDIPVNELDLNNDLRKGYIPPMPSGWEGAIWYPAPTNADSTQWFIFQDIRPGTTITVQIQTFPGKRYEITFTDSLWEFFHPSLNTNVWPSFSHTNRWHSFSNTNASIYVETNSVESSYTFVDDFTAGTSGSLPVKGWRHYLVNVSSLLRAEVPSDILPNNGVLLHHNQPQDTAP